MRDRFQPKLELMTRTVCTDAEAQLRWRALAEPLGWRPQFRGWITLPEASVDNGHQPPGEGLCFFQRRHDQLYVNASGEVTPCCFHPGAATLGDLKRQTFNEIMAGERRKAFSETMQSARADMAVCGSCPAQDFISF